MLTRKLLGSVALAAFIGTSAFAQDMMEMPNDGRYEIQMDAAGAPMMGADGTPVVLDTTTGQPADPSTYRLDGDEIILLMADTDAQAVTTGAATAGAVAGGNVVVEQGEATVDVTVPDPVVTVDQAQPEVTVEQPQPEITVQQSPPTVNVQQQAPIITVEQSQPVVTVSIPEPIVTVRMPQPNVQVAQGQPMVAVEQPEPIVRFVRPEPRIVVQEAEAQVRVTNAEPQVQINRTQSADVRIEQAQPEIDVQQTGEAQVNVTDAQPVINVEQAEGAAVEVEQAEAQVNVAETPAPNVAVVELTPEQQERRNRLVTDGFIADPNVVETPELREQRIGAYSAYADNTVGDLVGYNVLAAGGEDVGEVDNLARMGDQLYAIVGVGGFLGIGERNVAVPLHLMEPVGDDLVIRGLTAEQLEDYPEYDETQGEYLPAADRVGDLY